MIGIAFTLVAAWFQAGTLDLGPNHVRVVAIGDCVRPGSPVWDASGRKLTVAEIKAIKGIPDLKKPEYKVEYLRNKTDIGRFVVLKYDNPKGWLVAVDGRSHKIL